GRGADPKVFFSRRCRRGACARVSLSTNLSAMFRVSPDNPAYYLTSVAKDRLPVFRTDRTKTIACGAIDEARRSGGFLIFAYVIMPDHLHLVTSSALEVSETLRYINGVSGRRIITYLKECGHDSSL